MEISAAVADRRSASILGLSAQDKADRRNFVGASDANIICGGDKEKIYKLWQVKTGAAEAEDLSNVLQVQMGTWTEDFNLYWFEKNTGRKVEARKQVVVHPAEPWLRVSLDGVTTHPDFHPDEQIGAVIDAKHVGGFQEIDEVLRNYTPQLVIGMECLDLNFGILSVLTGNYKWEWKAIPRDKLQSAQIIGACRKFWGHVLDGTPPVIPDNLLPPVPVSAMRKVSMVFSNAWANAEIDYLAHEDGSKKFDEAKKAMKELVERDVNEAKGGKLMAIRNKAGSISFKKL